MKQIDGTTAARLFIEAYYPDCSAALLCGSVARGDATTNSDLDVLIVIEQEGPSYRKSYRDFGWFIEAFSGSRSFYEEKVLRYGNNRNPSLIKSIEEAIILRDRLDFAQNLKTQAFAALERGPE